MERFVALYRGINVGGKNLVKMELLRGMHAQLGHRNVASYIQSGNVIFSGAGGAEKIVRDVERQFAKQFGFEARVLIASASRWAAMAGDNPYAEIAKISPERLHLGVCVGDPSAAGVGALYEKAGGSEKFVLRDDVIYLHTPDGLGKSKFAAGMEKAAGVSITFRNWRTVETLLKMLTADGSCA